MQRLHSARSGYCYAENDIFVSKIKKYICYLKKSPLCVCDGRGSRPLSPAVRQPCSGGRKRGELPWPRLTEPRALRCLEGGPRERVEGRHLAPVFPFALRLGSGILYCPLAREAGRPRMQGSLLRAGRHGQSAPCLGNRREGNTTARTKRLGIA